MKEQKTQTTSQDVSRRREPSGYLIPKAGAPRLKRYVPSADTAQRGLLAKWMRRKLARLNPCERLAWPAPFFETTSTEATL